MPIQQGIQTKNWRLRFWLQHMFLKKRISERIIKIIAPLFRLAIAKKILRYIPTILRFIPNIFRGRDYNLCRQNLALLGKDDAACDLLARQYIAIDLQRRINQHLYDITKPKRMQARIDSLVWRDPQALFPRSFNEPTLILFTHTGEYWVAVAGVMIRTKEPSHFIIPALAQKGDLTYESIMSLALFGHTVEVVDINDPVVALTMARGIRKGKRVMIFCDMPVSFGDIRFGEPVTGTFFGRQSQFVKGPLFLASKMKCNILLLGHRAQLGETGEFHAFGWIDKGNVEEMSLQLWQALERFISESPENWFYLPRMEAFFHFQVATNKMANTIPLALLGRNN